jgi:hypothetical protein
MAWRSGSLPLRNIPFAARGKVRPAPSDGQTAGSARRAGMLQREGPAARRGHKIALIFQGGRRINRPDQID